MNSNFNKLYAQICKVPYSSLKMLMTFDLELIYTREKNILDFLRKKNIL